MNSIERRLSQLEKKAETMSKHATDGEFRDPENGWLIFARGGILLEMPDNGRRDGMEDLPAFDRTRWESIHGSKNTEGAQT